MAYLSDLNKFLEVIIDYQYKGCPHIKHHGSIADNFGDNLTWKLVIRSASHLHNTGDRRMELCVGKEKPL